LPRCPFFTSIPKEETKMIGAQAAPVAHVAEALQEVSSAAGLTLEDVVDLLVAGVTVTDLLGYAQAAATNRLN
jgi:hypothetical protein